MVGKGPNKFRSMHNLFFIYIETAFQNLRIGIVQKAFERPGWFFFAKMILPIGDHFGKRTAWLLMYFLNYAYYDILQILANIL